MPLVDLSGTDAVETRKHNAFAGWGDRTQPNRVEPIARPDFAVPFTIEPGEKIFTVGSCFARNVELELLRRGFNLPMRDLFTQPAFAGLDPGVVNNFGTPSIYNEFAWAFGDKPFVPDEHILEVQPGKFIDLHVISSMRPAAKEVVEARRRAIIEAYRAALDCRVVIITLGLVEIWYDSQTGYYLNSAPMPGMMRREPERFRLHVLSYEETYKFLDDALQLLRRKGRDDLHVILTVSPVPLTVTHRPQDVMVANTYSKSVLRTVAETLTFRYDFVTYYPSYESIILSDRKAAWCDDFTHVTHEIVAVNVGRMVDAYVCAQQIDDSLREQMKTGGIAVAVEKANTFRQGSQEAAEMFFKEFRHFSSESLDFALEEAQFYSGMRNYQQALDCLTNAPGGLENDKSVQLAGTCLQQLDRADEAYALVDKVINRGVRSGGLWKMLFIAATKTNDVEKVLGVLGRWSHASPHHAGRANGLVARWFHERGEMERALNYFNTSHILNSADTLVHIYYVETLNVLGRKEEALAMFHTINPASATEVIRHGRLAKALGVTLGS